jgi:hypothetical protein
MLYSLFVPWMARRCASAQAHGRAYLLDGELGPKLPSFASCLGALTAP